MESKIGGFHIALIILFFVGMAYVLDWLEPRLERWLLPKQKA